MVLSASGTIMLPLLFSKWQTVPEEVQAVHLRIFFQINELGLEETLTSTAPTEVLCQLRHDYVVHRHAYAAAA